jgi:hypothetical protein
VLGHREQVRLGAADGREVVCAQHQLHRRAG